MNLHAAAVVIEEIERLGGVLRLKEVSAGEATVNLQLPASVRRNRRLTLALKRLSSEIIEYVTTREFLRCWQPPEGSWVN